MKRALWAAVAMATAVVGCSESGNFRSTVPSVNGPTAIVQHIGPGSEGCTPGFWKNHTEDWVGYTPGQTLESVFDVPDSLGIDNQTFLEALNTGGGGVSALLRHAVAALLNTAHPDVNYPVPNPADTIGSAALGTGVNGALASGDTEFLKDLLESHNELGAPGFCD